MEEKLSEEVYQKKVHSWSVGQSSLNSDAREIFENFQ
jgi:hypothetical protein